ncbi:MAG: ribokinase [Promethearchaeota archaeon]
MNSKSDGRPRVVVVGSFNVDVVARVPRFPRPKETLEGISLLIAPGGKGSNQAVAAARCGARTWFVARVGRDPFADIGFALWREEGIETSHVTRSENATTGVALILVEDHGGQNSIVVNPGANATLTAGHVGAAAPAIAGADCVVACLEVPLPAVRRALELGKEAGATTILNPAPARGPLPADLLELVDVLVPNEVEAGQLTGLEVDSPGRAADAAKELSGGGGVDDGRVVVVTLGDRGAVACAGGELWQVPALEVEVVDTTGAGDAFVGAFACRLAELGSSGREGAVKRALEFAVAAGSLQVTRAGCAPANPRREEVERALLRLKIR